MKAFVLVALLGCVWLAGCGNGDKGSSGASSGSPVTAPVDYLGSVTKAEHSAVKSIDLSALTKAIQMFQVEQGRLPKDLNELVTMKYIAKIPEAPVGQKILYDASAGTVKITAQ